MLERFHVPPEDEVRVTPDALRRTVSDIFRGVGTSQEDADQGADVLVTADVRGVETHGVSNMLRAYVAQYLDGRLNATPELNIVRETTSAATVDGDGGLGVIQGPKAMRIAIAKARESGVGIVTVRNVGHTGAVGYYAMMAAEQDMVGVSLTAAGLRVLPPFGAEPRMGTNPIAIAAPTRDKPRFLYDAATSAIAGNKIGLAARVGALMHPGWIASWNGTPLMEEAAVPPPGEFHQLPLGSTREMGSHKGFGLALMVEILATCLSGALPTMLDPNAGSKQFLAAYNIEAFTDLEEFKTTMDEMLQTLEDTKTAPGHDKVIYPGRSEHEAELERQRDGIPLHREVIDWFNATTEQLGVPALVTMPG